MHETFQNLFTIGEPWPEKVIRSIAVYVFLLVILRIAGKREIGQVSTSDLIVLLLISNTVQNAIIGNETSLVGGLAGATILIALNKIIVRIAYRSERFRRVVDGDSVELIRDGQVQRNLLEEQGVAIKEMESAARAHGVAHLEHVRLAVLETNGTISIIPGSDDYDLSIEDRLERIELLLGQLMERMQPKSAGG